MRFSVVASGLVGAIVGFGGTLSLIIAAGHSVGADSAQIASWVTAICIAIAASTFYLSWRYRIPLVTAWSTPGLALIAATSGFNMNETVGAFILTGLAIIITALVKPVSLAIARIPASISSAMLAGVLLHFIIEAARQAGLDPAFVLPLVALFFILRLLQPAMAVIYILIAGFFYAFFTSRIGHLPPLEISSLSLVIPTFDIKALFGLALPLYLITMASQNLPGFAVLKAYGYEAPTKACLSVTGIVTVISAFFCAAPTNMAAISAAICTNHDAHPDKEKRWMTGPFYGLSYIIFALFGASFVAIFAALPIALIALIAGLALISAFSNAMTIALSIESHRFAAIVTFATTASGLIFFGIGAPFWALIAGLIVYGGEKILRR